tara:strand:+ start:349 stop:735 length:387 start_codon:yes stop_codon:yes gene_type:complete
MAMDINGADGYFAKDNHSRAGVWGKFSSDLKKAAIAEAKRDLTRILKRELDEPSDATDLTEFPRDDYAIFEQALYRLENSVIADGSQATAKFIAGRTETNEVRERHTFALAPAARRWILRAAIMVSRG